MNCCLQSNWDENLDWCWCLFKMLVDDYPDQDYADNGVCLELGSRVCTPRGRAVCVCVYTVHLEVEVVELVEPCVCVCTCVCLESGQPCVCTQRSRWRSWWSLQMSKLHPSTRADFTSLDAGGFNYLGGQHWSKAWQRPKVHNWWDDHIRIKLTVEEGHSAHQGNWGHSKVHL